MTELANTSDELVAVRHNNEPWRCPWPECTWEAGWTQGDYGHLGRHLAEAHDISFGPEWDVTAEAIYHFTLRRRTPS